MRAVATCLVVCLAAVSCTSSAEAGDEPREIELFVSSVPAATGPVPTIAAPTGQPGDDAADPAAGRSDREVTGVAIPSTGTPPGETGSGSVPSADVPASMAPSTVSFPDSPSTDASSTSVPSPNVSSTVVASTTTTEPPAEVWRIGLVNTEGATGGSYPSFRVGVAAAVNWANGQETSVDQRTLELVTCRNPDATAATRCAADLVASDVDMVIRGIDLFVDDTAPILDSAAVPTLGGIVWSGTDARLGSAALTVGGPVAAHAGVAAALVDEGFGSTVVVRDDTAEAAALVAEFVAPVLDAALVSHIEVAVPLGTTDATDVLAPVVGHDADSWIVLTRRELCEPVIRARSDHAVSAATFYGPSCHAPAIIDAVGPLMERSFFVTELVSTPWLDVVPSHVRDDHALAVAVLAAVGAEYAEDDLAMAGHAVATAVVEALRRNGADPTAVRDLVVPHPRGLGDIDCRQSSTYPAVCSADLAVSPYVEGSLIGPPAVVNGIRGR